MVVAGKKMLLHFVVLKVRLIRYGLHRNRVLLSKLRTQGKLLQFIVILFLSICEDDSCVASNRAGGLECYSTRNHTRLCVVIVSTTGLN